MRENIKLPLVVKVICLILMFILISYNIIYRIYSWKINRKKFYEAEFATLVVSDKIFEGRTVEFLLENGFTVYFLPPINDKLLIGDSIVKKKNTYNYFVYRTDSESHFTYFKTYSSDVVK